MVKAIIFDFGGVFNNAHETTAGFDRAAQRMGTTAQALYDLLYSGPEWQAAKIGGMTSEQYWRHMMQALGYTGGNLAAFRADLFEGEQIDPQVVLIAERLAKRYPLALLSNATDELEDLLETQFGLHHLFGVVVNSARIGVAKPDRAAFDLVLSELGVAPHEALFIDDKPRNVAAAESLGIPSIHFVDAPSLLRELEARNLL